MSAEQPDQRPSRSRGERRLAIAGAALFALILLLAIGLWVRHGEEIYVSRIITAIANCF